MMELLTLSFRSSSRLALTCLTLLPAVCRAQQQPPPPASAVVATDADCFTSSSVVGAVLGTFFATAIVLAVLVFILWWIYYRRLPSSSFNGKSTITTNTTPLFNANRTDYRDTWASFDGHLPRGQNKIKQKTKNEWQALHVPPKRILFWSS